MLAGNELTHIPESMQQLRRLALLRLSANCLARIPGKFAQPIAFVLM